MHWQQDDAAENKKLSNCLIIQEYSDNLKQINAIVTIIVNPLCLLDISTIIKEI